MMMKIERKKLASILAFLVVSAWSAIAWLYLAPPTFAYAWPLALVGFGLLIASLGLLFPTLFLLGMRRAHAFLLLLAVLLPYLASPLAPNWTCAAGPVLASVASASGLADCNTECTDWNSKPCGGWSSCYNKNISCSAAGIDQNGRKCNGCCFACKVVCDDPTPTPTSVPPTATSTMAPPPTPIIFPTFPPTATKTATPPTPVFPTITKTTTAIPPTITRTATATNTATPIPPTATKTATGTNTATPIPPTATKTATATATNTATATKTATATATPTPLPPTISGSVSCSLLGTNAWCRDGAVLHLAASDPQGYPVTITGSAGDTPIDCVGSCTVALPAGQGTAAYTVTSTSGQTASGSTAWKYDPDAPSLFISAAGNSNGAWFNTDVQLNATATDAISGALPPTVSLDGGSPFSLPKSIHLDGIYSAEFSVLDNAGNITTQPFSFRIDQTPPDLWWRMDTSGAWTGPVLLHGTYGDLLSGTQRVEISTDNGLTWQTAALTTASLSWDYPWQTEDLPNGPRAVLARASDLAGNNSAPISIGLTLNNHPPLVDLASSWYVWESGGLRIASNITPLASVEIIVRDPLLRYPTTSIQASVQTRVVTWDRLLGPYLAPDGDYSVSVRVCDIYGLCATDSGVIHIPVTTFTPTPAPLLDPIIVPFVPPAVVVPPDGQVILLTWPEDAPSPQPIPFNPLPALLALLALLFLAALATLMILHDPRPVALQHLAQAIEPGLFTRKTPSTD